MNPAELIVAVVTLAGFVLGLAWHAGQLTQILRELRRIATDHETRIRRLEDPPRHAAAEHRR